MTKPNLRCVKSGDTAATYYTCQQLVEETGLTPNQIYGRATYYGWDTRLDLPDKKRKTYGIIPSEMQALKDYASRTMLRNSGKATKLTASEKQTVELATTVTFLHSQIEEQGNIIRGQGDTIRSQNDTIKSLTSTVSQLTTVIALMNSTGASSCLTANVTV